MHGKKACHCFLLLNEALELKYYVNKDNFSMQHHKCNKCHILLECIATSLSLKILGSGMWWADPGILWIPFEVCLIHSIIFNSKSLHLMFHLCSSEKSKPVLGYYWHCCTDAGFPPGTKICHKYSWVFFPTNRAWSGPMNSFKVH